MSIPHQEEYNCLTCHIVGLNPLIKKELIEELNKKVFNPIDLDEINQQIINDNEMNKMYTQYQKFKDTKNDKFKELEKKMTFYWENKFLELLNEKVKIDKKNILIGQSNHYKYLNRKINLNTPNKFIIQSTENDIKKLIQYNLETYKADGYITMFATWSEDHNAREFGDICCIPNGCIVSLTQLSDN
jgi:hypothetical protein